MRRAEYYRRQRRPKLNLTVGNKSSIEDLGCQDQDPDAVRSGKPKARLRDR